MKTVIFEVIYWYYAKNKGLMYFDKFMKTLPFCLILLGALVEVFPARD